jgi:diacylglycerol kinase
MIRFKRLIKSFTYAFRGLAKVAHEEQNFRLELIAAAVVLTLSFIIGLAYWEIALLIIVIGLVLIMEIVNSAVEAISDVLKPKLDDYVKRIKDMTAAGVMTASLAALLVGCLIFGHYLLG